MRNSVELSPSFWVIDFGSQTTQLICRRLREMGVCAEVLPWTVDVNQLNRENLRGIIFSGGPRSVYESEAPFISRDIFSLKVPLLGICYGLQMTAKLLGASVISGPDRKEFGPARLNIEKHSPLLFGVSPESKVWMSHGDHLENLPEGFEKVASTPNCPFTVCQNSTLKIYGVQFHPEVTHSEFGKQILHNFVFKICNAEKDWTLEDFTEKASREIREQVGDKTVICGLSGGVDSSVLALLLHRAIGSQLQCIFVDHGLLRLNEKEQVEKTFGEHIGARLRVVEVSDRFFKALKGVRDPEKKRKIIGRLFIDVFQEAAREFPNAHFLAQGTIYSDVIESAGNPNSHAHQIKSHHNVGGLPEELGFELVEPLRVLFKDEVRELGRFLGLENSLVDRHPFPGPGLAVRIPGEVLPEDCDTLRLADAIFIEELRSSGWYHKSFQAFAVLLPVRSTGVMGDARTYQKVCALRCVSSEDVMTADWTKLPFDLLARVSNRIINEVPGINRVVYDVSSKPPATIEWE
jgi:GMP synthase (glutamine-hydrolysing)